MKFLLIIPTHNEEKNILFTLKSLQQQTFQDFFCVIVNDGSTDKTKEIVENFVETGTKDHPSKVDIGPVNTMISNNYIDGLRLRMSAQTTANLNPHL